MFALWRTNPVTAGSHGLTYWLTGDEDFVQTYTVVLGTEWPYSSNVMQWFCLLDGIQIESDVGGVSALIHDLPIPATNRLEFTVRIDHSLFADGAHSLHMFGSPYLNSAFDAPLQHITVFKNGVVFPPYLPVAADLAPRDDSWSAPRTAIRSEFGLPDVSSFLPPSTDGSFDIDLVVQPGDDTPALCPGDPTVPLGVVAFLDRRQVPFADGSMVLRFEPHQSQRATMTTRLEGLPLDPGHRLDLVGLGGLNRPGETPAGEYSAWSGGLGGLSVVVW
jgi:hypothetical protein